MIERNLMLKLHTLLVCGQSFFKARLARPSINVKRGQLAEHRPCMDHAVVMVPMVTLLATMTKLDPSCVTQGSSSWLPTLVFVPCWTTFLWHHAATGSF